MISKVITGRTFYGCCRYICEDQGRATVLEAEGVRDYNYRLMAHDFEMQQRDLPNKHKAVFHGILSFYPGESLTDELMVKIASEYLDKIGVTDTQYAITKHTDTNHLHLHIVANLVNNKGRAISESWIGYRGKKAAQELTQKYQLVPAEKKDLTLTNLQALNTEEATRYEIYSAIQQLLPRTKSIEQLNAALLKSGIEAQFKYKSGTQEMQGISFKKGEYCFKGSSIDRKYSLSGLQKLLQSQDVRQEQKRTVRTKIR
jgi:hypothetical protein